MVGLLGKMGIGRGAKLTPEQEDEIARNLYVARNPAIDRAYSSDPRTALGNTLAETGTSMAPLQGGITEGIARALSGGLAGVVGRQQREKYGYAQNLGAREKMKAGMGSANEILDLDPAAVASAGAAPVQAAPPVGAVPPAQPPVQPPPPPVMPPPAAMPPQGPVAPVAAALGQGPQPAQSAQAPFPSPTSPASATATAVRPRVLRRGDTARVGGAPTLPADMSQAATYFTRGIIPNEGGTDAQGNFLRSPAGAWGPSQLMPGTAPEAMRLAGFKESDERWKTDRNINLRAGSAYYARQLRTFNDPILAAGAYNGGGGRMRSALRQQRSNGGSLSDYLPGETRQYMSDFAARNGMPVPPGFPPPQEKAVAAGGGAVAGGGGGGAGYVEEGPIQQGQMESTPELPQPMAEPEAPKFGDLVKSTRLEFARRMMGNNMGRGGEALIMSEVDPYLDQGLKDSQDIRMQREQDLRAQDTQRYGAQLGQWGHQQNKAFDLPYDEYSATTANNRQVARENTARQFTRDERLGSQQFEAAESDKTREARERAGHDPVFAQKEYFESQNTLQDATGALAMLDQMPDAVGARFVMGSDLSQRTHPEGVKVRAAIVNLAGLLLHGRSGAAVTPEEWARNKDWIPTVHDTPQAIRDKMASITRQAQIKQQTLQNMYPGSDMFRGGGAGVDPAAPFAAAAGGKTGDPLVDKYL